MTAVYPAGKGRMRICEANDNKLSPAGVRGGFAFAVAQEEADGPVRRLEDKNKRSSDWVPPSDAREFRKRRREVGFVIFMWLAPALAAGTLAGMLP
jgi:hypothetical protein